MRDDLGAFLPGAGIRLTGAGGGPLGGLAFAAKDLFDVQGFVTGCGNPDWSRTHAPAASTAPAIRALLGAGASLAGKTVTDELAYSLTGQNVHYGTPVNPAAPDRIPGGSSSGSASAVAGGLVDFALGTDTGGSVRIPAALCGVLGFRPSHGAVSLEGVMPLAPSFDTVGWFARDPGILARVGDVLLPPGSTEMTAPELLVAGDARAVVDGAVQAVVEAAIPRIADRVRRVQTAQVAASVPGEPRDLSGWMDCFRIVQGHEIWGVHGEWIESVRPEFAPDVAGRFAWASRITGAEAAEATSLRESFRSALDRLLNGGTILCLPTAPCIAPRRNAGDEEIAGFRTGALTLTCVAGLAGLPQVTLPIDRASGEGGAGDGPVGLSLIGRRGADRPLLGLAVRLSPALAAPAG